MSIQASDVSSFSWNHHQPFVIEVTVTDTHLDEFEHTNNVVYLSWMQDVAKAHSAALGLTFNDYARLGIGCVARRHEINYVLPTFKGDHILLGTWIHQNDGRTDMWRGYQFIRTQDGKTVAHGLTQWVCIDMATGRPKRQPPEFLAAYSVVKAGMPSTALSHSPRPF